MTTYDTIKMLTLIILPASAFIFMSVNSYKYIRTQRIKNKRYDLLTLYFFANWYCCMTLIIYSVFVVLFYKNRITIETKEPIKIEYSWPVI